MTGGKMLITLSTAIALGLLGAVSAVEANDTDRNGAGGYRAGPQRQSSHGAGAAHHPSMRQGGSAYGFAPGYSYPARHDPNRETRFERNWFGYQDCPGTEGDC
jgi:hypothetical protein